MIFLNLKIIVFIYSPCKQHMLWIWDHTDNFIFYLFESFISEFLIFIKIHEILNGFFRHMFYFLILFIRIRKKYFFIYFASNILHWYQNMCWFVSCIHRFSHLEFISLIFFILVIYISVLNKISFLNKFW